MKLEGRTRGRAPKGWELMRIASGGVGWGMTMQPAAVAKPNHCQA